MVERRTKFSSNESGFTLLELIVSMALLSIIGAIAAANFPKMLASFERTDARTALVLDLRRAQAEAISWGCRGIFTIAAGGKSYSHGCDFLSYDTTVPPAADKIFSVHNLPARITISANAPIIFNSRGQAVDTDGNMTNINVYLWEDPEGGGPPSSFFEGEILGTGVFAY